MNQHLSNPASAEPDRLFAKTTPHDPGTAAASIVVYRAEIDTTNVGISGGLEIISGVRLRLFYQDGYDCLADELQNVGADAVINLPGGGLIPGQLYQPRVTNETRDFESGCLDSWEITLYPFTGVIPE